MTTHTQPSAAELYQQGLDYFKQADWSEAIASFEALQAISDGYPEVDALLADARLKLSIAASEQPTALPAPRRRLLTALTGAVALLVVLAVVGWPGERAAQPAVVAVAPTLTPTAPAAAVPTTRPRPTSAPTSAPLPDGTLVVTAEADVALRQPANIELIVDASGSMLAQAPDSDRPRWQAAQAALGALLDSGAITEQSAVALRTYGRRRGNDCADLEIIQRRSRFNPAALRGLIGRIKPAVGGMTPLSAALHAAADDLQTATGSAVVILLTDGLESCGGDPQAEAAALIRAAPERSVHVIGFAVERRETRAGLRQIARAGRGFYFDARTGAELAESLRQSLGLSYQLINGQGEPVSGGLVGAAPLTLEPGDYTLRVNTVPLIEQTLTVRSDEQVVVRLRQSGGVVLSEIVADTP